uniref:CCN TSP1 domain-containing protein n=1 Tax=Echeneis naucrates TaxID=173247 RepID=A0A665T2T8_ECHNA
PSPQPSSHTILSLQVLCQMCSGLCQCSPTMPRCPLGIPLMIDSCGCCQLYPRQEGERGLKCDQLSLVGIVDLNELGCELNGTRLEEGQVFQPSCAQLCCCLGGGMSCMPLCTADLLPGHCCKEWVFDSTDDSISSNPSAGPWGALSGLLSASIPNGIEWTSDWSPCSHSCGPGVSIHTTNRWRACLLQAETRLCQIRLCQTLL